MKYCPRCDQTKEDSDFATRGSRGGRAGYCRSCHGLIVQENRVKKYEYVNTFKRENGCQVCGLKEVVALDLHHTGEFDKDDAVSTLIANGASMERVVAEVAKCKVLCANHHRMLHAGTLTGGRAVECASLLTK